MTEWTKYLSGPELAEFSAEQFSKRNTFIPLVVKNIFQEFNVINVKPILYEDFPALFDGLKGAIELFERETHKVFSAPIISANFTHKKYPKHHKMSGFCEPRSLIGLDSEFIDTFKKVDNNEKSKADVQNVLSFHPGINGAIHEVGHLAAEIVLPYHLSSKPKLLENFCDFFAVKVVGFESYEKSLLATCSFGHGVTPEEFKKSYANIDFDTHPSFNSRMTEMAWVNKVNPSFKRFAEVLEQKGRFL